MPDIVVSSQLDTSTWLRDASRAANSLPRVTVRTDTRSLGIISGQVSEFQRSLQAASARVIAFGATSSQIFLVYRAFQQTLKAMIDVEKQLTDINSILSLSQSQLKKFSSDLFKVANETGTSFAVAAEGAVELSRQGLSATETLKRLKDSLTLTRLSGLGAADSVNAITTAINSFNKESLDSTQILNRLAAVDANYAVSSRDLAEAISKTGSAAQEAGVGFNKFLGIVTAVRQITGQSGNIIGNAFRGIFQRIEKPEVLSQLREMGVLVEDLSGNSLSADKILEQLGNRYDQLSESQQKLVVNLGAGIYRSNQFVAILKDLGRQNSITAGATNEAANATDQAARRQAELNKTLASSINETINNLTNAASKIGKLTLSPALKVVIEGNALIPGLKDFGKNLQGEGEKGGEQTGFSIGEGMLKGIGNYLAGPGLALGLALVGKLFVTFGQFAAKSLAQILEVTGSRYQAEQAITKLLSQEPTLYGRINALAGDTKSIQALINQELLRGNVLLNERAAAVAKVSGLTGATGLRALVSNTPFTVKDEQVIVNPRVRKAAVGLVPAISETLGAYAGGYQPGAIKELNIKGLGNVIYNTAEKVKQFPGLSQPAIIPPQSSSAGINYNKSFIQAHGFSPYKAEGHIPNYTIISAAYKTQGGKIYTGSFHGLAYEKIPHGEQSGNLIAGFIDDKLGFLTREQALPEARAAKQLYKSFLDREERVKRSGLGLYTKKLDTAFLPLPQDEYHSSGFSPYGNKGFLPNFVNVFHATNSKFSEFKPTGLGIHASDSIVGANKFLEVNFGNKSNNRVLPLDFDIKNPLTIKDFGSFSSPATILSKLYQQNIIDINEYKQLARKYKLSSDPFNFFDYEGGENISSKTGRRFTKNQIKGFERQLSYEELSPIRDFLKKKGYDGIKYKNNFDSVGNSYVAFRTDQIKTLSSGFSPYANKGFLPNFGKTPEFSRYHQLRLEGLSKENANALLTGSKSIDKIIKESFPTKMWASTEGGHQSAMEEMYSLTTKRLQDILNLPYANKGIIPNFIPNYAETIKMAAIKYGNNIFRGSFHGEALVKMGRTLGFGGDIPFPSNYDEGFVTSMGRFVSREEAARMANLNRKVAYSEDFGYSGTIPNYANPKDSFLNFLREINPSYVTKFRAIQKEDTGLAKFLRQTTDQRGAPAMQQMGGLLKKDLLQYTPRAYELGTTAYANLKESPQQIRAGIGKIFGKFGMEVPNFMPQINRGQLEILLKDSQFSKKLKSFTYTNAKGETKDYNLAQWRVRPDLNVGAPAPAGYKNWTDLDNKTKSLALYVQSPDGKIGKKRFSLDSFKQLRAEGDTFDIMNRGFVPNFNSLSNAISREHAAGLSLNQIRIGASPSIKSSLNPLGLGVYNTRDEPGGLQQGIQRVASMGLDPKRAGIPNYAAGDTFGGTFGVSQRGQLSFLELKELNTTINSYKFLIDTGLANQKKLNQATSALANKFLLTQESFDKVATALKVPGKRQLGIPEFSESTIANKIRGQIINGPEQYKSPFLYQGTPEQTQGQGLKRRVIYLPDVGQVTKQQIEQLSKLPSPSLSTLLRYGTTGKGLDIDKLLQSSSTYKTRTSEQQRLQPIVSQKFNAIAGSDYLTGSRSIFNSQLKNLFQSARQLSPEEFQKIRGEVINFARQGTKQFITKDFNQRIEQGIGIRSSLNPFSLFANSNYQKLKAEAEKTGQIGSFNQRKSDISNRALTASFVLPLLTGVAQQGAESLLGDKSPNARGAARAIGGLGNVGSFALTGLGISGGNPIGALVGGGIGLLSELPATLKAFTDTLPDLQRNLEKITEVSQKTSTSFQSFLVISQKLSEIQRGEVPSTVGQQKALERERGKALANLPSQARQRILTAEKNGDFGEVARIADIYSNREEQKRLFTGDLGSIIKRSEDSKPTAGTKIKEAFISSYLSGGEGVLGGIGGVARAGVESPFILLNALFGQKSLNIFKKSQDIYGSELGLNETTNRLKDQRDIKPFAESLLNLTDKEGKTLLKTITPQEIQAFQAQNAKSPALGQNQLKSILAGKGIDFSEQIQDIEKLSEPLQKTLSIALQKVFDKKNIDTINENSRVREKINKDFVLELDNFNERIISLSTTGKQAVTKFEIDVLKRFSEATTKIEIGGINRRFESQKTLLQAGDNPYLKNYLDLQEKRGSAQETYQKGNEEIKGSFSGGFAKLISTGLTDFFEKAKLDISTDLTKGKTSADVKKFVEKRTGIISNIFSGFGEVGGSNSDQFSLKGGDFTEQNALEIKARIKKQTGLLDENKQISALRENVVSILQESKAPSLNQLDIINSTKHKNVFDAIGKISGEGAVETRKKLLESTISDLEKDKNNDAETKKLIENLRAIDNKINEYLGNLATQSAQLYANLKSTNEKAAAEFIANKKLFGVEFAIGRSKQTYQTGLDVGLITQQGLAGRQKLISDPFQQLEIEKQLTNRSNLRNTLSGLSDQIPTLQFSKQAQINPKIAESEIYSEISNRQKKKTGLILGSAFGFEGATQELNQIDGEIVNMTKAWDLFNSATEKTAETVKQLKEDLKLQMNFSDFKASALRSQNINKAADNQTFSNKDLGKAFTSELQYNTNDFWRDMATNAQDFGKDFKEAFKGGFREAITGAKTFEDAMRGIGINIASNFLSKGSDMVVSSLLGSVFNSKGTVGALSGLFGGKSTGGYARGGFVDMGSGIRDDVPAFLSGGEFVLNKRATQRIGKQNLDVINFGSYTGKGGVNQPDSYLKPTGLDFSGAITSDSSKLTGNSAIIKLANSLEINKFGTIDKNNSPLFNTSKLLSSTALTDTNNPQNRLRYAREKWAFDKRIFDKQVTEARSKFENQQITSLITSFITAGIGAAAMGRVGNMKTSGTFNAGSSAMGGAGSGPGLDFPSNAGSNFMGYVAKGGYIPKFTRGGYFGGDSPKDRPAAMVMGGEYIVSPKTVQNYGVNYFKGLNGMAGGGYVGGSYNTNDNLSDNISKMTSILEEVRDKLNPSSNIKDSQTKVNNKPGGNVFNINITTSIASDGSTKSAKTDVTSGNSDNSTQDKENMVKLSNMIKMKTIEVINEQSRNGGILSEKFAARR